MGWRRKLMRLTEWQPFQERFATHLMMTGGDPDVVMFAENAAAGSDVTAIYIHSPGLEALERSSPGGWTASSAPAGEHVSLLVGDARAFERFDIKR